MTENSARVKGTLRPVVAAIAETVIAEELGRDDLAGVRFLSETADGLLHKLVNMPSYMGVGMMALTLTFDGLGVASGAPFHRLPLAKRRVIFRRLKGVAVGLLAAFFAFYEKMGSFIYYSHLEEAGLHPGA